MPRVVEPRVGPITVDGPGNGCFETMRSYRGRIFRLDAHLERLYASAKYLGLTPPMERRRIARQLTQALAASKLSEAIVRIALRPEGKMSASPYIVVEPVQMPSASAYRRGISLAVVPTRKFSINSIDQQAKYSARLGSVLAVLDAQLRGVDEALWVDELGCVTESTASNFGIVRGRVILTPPCGLGLLAGITQSVLFELARLLHVAVRESPITRHEIYNAQEAFLLSTIKEILPVRTIDGRHIGTGSPGPITRRLCRAFQKLVTRELAR